MKLTIKEDSQGCLLEIKVVPGSSRTNIAGMLGDSIKITVAAAPEKGKANKELIKYLAKTLDISKSSITIVTGEKEHHKLVRVYDLTAQEIQGKLADLL